MEYYLKMKQIRQNHGDNQQHLADLYQTTQHQVSKYEAGIQELPIRRLIQFCKHYNVSADYILGLTEHPQTPA